MSKSHYEKNISVPVLCFEYVFPSGNQNEALNIHGFSGWQYVDAKYIRNEETWSEILVHVLVNYKCADQTVGLCRLTAKLYIVHSAIYILLLVL